MGLPRKKPWEQLEKEPNRAYQCFRAFLDQKPAERNALQVYRQIFGKPNAQQPPGTYNTWMAKYDWRGRARAYDQMIAEVEIEAERAAAARRAKVWADRRAQIADTEWEMATNLEKKIAAMLQLPVTEKTITQEDVIDGVVDGQPVKILRQIVTVKPVRWNATTVQRYMEEASKLKRRAAEMTLDKIEMATDNAKSEPDNMVELARVALAKAREEFTDLDDEALLAMVASAYSVPIGDL